MNTHEYGIHFVITVPLLDRGWNLGIFISLSSG